MPSIHLRRAALATACCCAALAAPAIAAASPVVKTESGLVRGTTVPGGFAFRGLPYAAPPIGNLRWRPPHAPAGWHGIRDAGAYAPSCPQPPSPFIPPEPRGEDCLYLNVSTPGVHGHRHGGRPVLVWIHGGGFAQDGARNYDGTKLAADGTVVVTIGYRLGMLGFLAHPALASRPGGPTGNYGLMDQQAALRWVQRNIRHFGGDPRDVTIAGESAGGLAVLMHMVAPGSRGLFRRAIVQSGAFALEQTSLADAEAAGEQFASDVGCANQKASCLRQVPADELVSAFTGNVIPGVVDGAVLPESIGTALAHGRFAHVPIINGTNHDEERLFVSIDRAIANGTNVGIPGFPVTPDNYESDIRAVLGVSPARAAAIVTEYPLSAFGSASEALSTLLSDASFVCGAVQVDHWTSAHAPTFAYSFDDDAAPQQFVPPGIVPQVATHGSELQYLFDLPNAPLPGPLDAAQQQLAATMRGAWERFAAGAAPWPAFPNSVISLTTPRTSIEHGFVAAHHCGFWGLHA